MGDVGERLSSDFLKLLVILPLDHKGQASASILYILISFLVSHPHYLAVLRGRANTLCTMEEHL